MVSLFCVVLWYASPRAVHMVDRLPRQMCIRSSLIFDRTRQWMSCLCSLCLGGVQGCFGTTQNTFEHPLNTNYIDTTFTDAYDRKSGTCWSWTSDLSGCNRLLCHWANAPGYPGRNGCTTHIPYTSEESTNRSSSFSKRSLVHPSTPVGVTKPFY